MADQAFNITKGRTTELAWRVKNNDPATSGFVLVALKTVEADATLIDRADLAAIARASTSRRVSSARHLRPSRSATPTRTASRAAPPQ